MEVDEADEAENDAERICGAGCKDALWRWGRDCDCMSESERERRNGNISQY